MSAAAFESKELFKGPHPEEARSAVSKDRGLSLENHALRDAVSDETAPQDEVFKVFK